MKLNLKIILPILLLLVIILISFGYILFFIDQEVDSVTDDTYKFRQLNDFSQKLSKEQEVSEYNMILYIFNQEPKALIAITQSELAKAKIIDDIYPFIESAESKELIDNYIESRNNIDVVRTELLNAILSKNKFLVDQKYANWNSKTEKIREAIDQINTQNANSLGNIFNTFKIIGERVAIVVICLFILVVFIIFIFYHYLKYTITAPIFKLSSFAEEVADKKFTNIMDDNVIRNDEIGSLFKAFIEMSKKLKNSYGILEQSVKERTAELTNRTLELEGSQKATLNILEDLNKERQILVETKALDEAILTSIADGLTVIDVNGNITYVNESFELITGWKSSEVIGRNFHDVIPSETDKGIRIKPRDRFINRILNGENPSDDVINTVYYIRKDGSKFPVSSLVKRITLNNKTIGAVKTFRDATKEKDIDKAKTEFVSLAAHQLRTPLSAISWYTEMLLSGDAGELLDSQKKYLEQIYQGNQRMIDMVKSFLNVSRIDMGNLEIEKQSIDICKLLQNVVDEQSRKIEAKKIKFKIDCESNIPEIEVDPSRMRMVFQNLLSNAIKYTPDGGAITVSVTLNTEEKNLTIKFSDTGFGIPKAAQEKIFSTLFRAENVIEKATEGTGLGLYIVKNIIENSGGKVWFESTEDKGSTFYLTLPL